MTALDEELAPLLLAPPEYIELLNRLHVALGFPNQRLPLLLGIDGLDGAGKSSLAAWLSWQLGMPVVHLDLFIIADTKPLTFKADQLAAIIDARLATRRPLIVEGILLLDAMTTIGREPDLLVFIEKHGNSSNLSSHIDPYIERQRPQARASHILTWSSAEHDARVERAHLHSSSR